MALSGTQYEVEFGSTALPSCLAIPFLGPRARLPLPPFGTVGLDLGSALPLSLLPVTSGAATLTLPIPASAALLGAAFGVQAILTDGVRHHLTPAVHDTVL
jgi:hypothetical protein